jgi:hypothetical protein
MIPTPNPLTDELVGEWLYRPGPTRMGTGSSTAHYADSIVANAMFTACGKRMEREVSGMALASGGGIRCQVCNRLRRGKR